MDADTIQQEARASMCLSASEIEFINLRLLDHMKRKSFSVPMLRLMHDPRSDTWAMARHVHKFYDAYRHVIRHADKKIDDATLSLAIRNVPSVHLYIMGMLTYFTQHHFVWIITRTQLVVTPYAPGQNAETVKKTNLLKDLTDPTTRPPDIDKGKVRMRACDRKMFEYLIRVDLGLSHLAILQSAMAPAPALAPAPVTSSSGASAKKRFRKVPLLPPTQRPLAPTQSGSARNVSPTYEDDDDSSSSSSDSSSSSSDSSSSDETEPVAPLSPGLSRFKSMPELPRLTLDDLSASSNTQSTDTTSSALTARGRKTSTPAPILTTVKDHRGATITRRVTPRADDAGPALASAPAVANLKTHVRQVSLPSDGFVPVLYTNAELAKSDKKKKKQTSGKK